MSTPRVLLVLVPLVLLAGVAFWLFNPGNVELSDAPQSMAAGGSAAPVVATAPEAAPANAAGAAGNAREAVASASAERGPAAGHALVGRVLDDAGAAVAGARVSCTPAPEFGGDEANPWDGDWDFDPEAMAERFAKLRQDRVDTVTDADGRFRLVPKPGATRSLEVRVRARLHVGLEKNAQRPGAGDVDLGALALKPGSLVSGRVVDRQNQPVVGARVQRRGKGEVGGNFDWDFEFPGAEVFAGRDGDEPVTDAQGQFELPFLPPGPFTLVARHPDHPLARLEGLSVEVGKSLTNLLIVAELGETLRGRITGVPADVRRLVVQCSARPQDQRGDKAEAPAIDFGMAADLLGDSMAFGEKSVVADGERSFVLRGLQVGRTYRVWATQPGRGLAGVARCTQRLEATAGTAGLELRYDPGITVTFRVVRDGGDTPVETLWVREQLKGGGRGMEDMFNGFNPRAGRSRKFPDGRVTIPGVRPKPRQTLSLTVEALGCARLERDGIALPAEGTLDLGVLRLTATPLVHVTVTAGGSEGERPVAGAQVRLEEQGESSERPANGIRWGGPDVPTGPAAGRTDAEGRCDLNVRPGTSVVVSVTSKEFAPYRSAPLAVPARDDVAHAVRMVRGGAVEVSVVMPDGTAVAGARVEHAPPFGNNDDRKAGADGRVVFERLTPGAHRFRLAGIRGGMQSDVRMPGSERRSGDATWESVTVSDGVQAALRLTRAPTASVRGVVRDNGAPLAGARVTLLDGPGASGGEARAEQLLQGAMAQLGGGGGRSARTGEDGTFQLKEVSAGQHRLRVTHKDRAMATVVAVTLGAGENTCDVDLTTARLRGTVRDPEGKPVAGASVSVRAAGGADGISDVVNQTFGEFMPGMRFDLGGGDSASVKSAADGSFELRGVESGVALQVRASAKGFAPGLSASTQVATGETREGVDVALVAGGRIKVTASGAGPFASVRATWAGEPGKPSPAPVVQMLRNGSVTLEGLRPGPWKVELMAMGDGQKAEPRTANVAAGETAEVNL